MPTGYFIDPADMGAKAKKNKCEACGEPVIEAWHCRRCDEMVADCCRECHMELAHKTIRVSFSRPGSGSDAPYVLVT